jgi:DNA-binding MarR family transcriptional regulator
MNQTPSPIFPQLWRVVRAIIADAHSELKETGLSVRAFFMLTRIEECRYPARLAEELILSPPTVSQIARELESLNYIKREVDQQDLRRYRFSLTSAGNKALQRVQSEIDRVVEKRIIGLSRADIKSLLAMLSALEQNEANR